MTTYEIATLALQFLAIVSQVAVAVVALYLARKANTINQTASMANALRDGLLLVRRNSRDAQRKHRALLDKFDDKESKTLARKAWQRDIDGVDGALYDITPYDSRVAHLKEVWEKVSEDSDSNLDPGKLCCDPEEKDRSRERYDSKHNAFVKEVDLLIVAAAKGDVR